MALVAILGGTVCTAGGYGAAQVERVVHPRHCPTPLADADKPCSPACQPKQTCYKGTCIDVATSLLLRVQTLEERVDRLAGGDTVISAGSMR